MESKDVNRSAQQTRGAPLTAAVPAPIRRQTEVRSRRDRRHRTQPPGSEQCGGNCEQHWRWWFGECWGGVGGQKDLDFKTEA